MIYLLRSVRPMKENFHGINSVEKLCRRHYRLRNMDRDDTIKVRVIGSGSYGDPASLYIRTSEHSKAIFNCGEGTFRLMHARGFKFRFITNIFCTRSDWECVGGVPSLARAIYDRCSQFPTLHGPPNLKNCLEKFATLTDLEPNVVNDRTFNSENFHDDIASQTDFVDLHRSSEKNPMDPSVIAYVCRLKSRDGIIDSQKIAHLGIPQKLKEKLLRGQNVQLDDGTVITATDVRSRDFPGANFLVIDVPSAEYLANLERNEELNLHLDDINSDIGMEFVAHFAKPEIIETPEYQRFMKRIAAKRHFALNESNSFCGLKWAHKLQYTLNSLDNDVFPLLRSKFDPTPTTYSCFDDVVSRDPVIIEPVSTFTTYLFPINDFRKKAEMAQESEETEGDDEDDSQDDSGDELDIELETIRPKSVERMNIFPRIVVLGTGSSFPGVTKTATSILVHTAPNTSVMLDCGEGTAGQLCRFYGTDTADVIRNIKGIWISHMHGDHHMGFMDLMRLRHEYMPLDREPLVLMAPKQRFGDLLNFYENNFSNVSNEYVMIDNEDLINSELSDEHKKQLNVIELKTCRTPHTEDSYAISLKLDANPNEFKMTFSGDSIPCNEMTELGKDSDLLIHEATLEDTLASSAAQKKHSTVSQAIEQGRAMNSKYTLLTHFSQRYRNLPPIQDHMLDSNIGVAFDNMEIIPSDLIKLNELYLKLKEVFRDEVSWNERRSRYYNKKYNTFAFET